MFKIFRKNEKLSIAKIPGLIKAFFLAIFVTVLILGCLVIYSAYQSRTEYKFTFYQVVSDRVSENLRIVFLSDLHLREFGKGNHLLIADVTALQPDLILIGGDMVTYGVDGYGNMLSLCRKLTKIAPCYGITGNHEDEKIFLDEDNELVGRFEDAGVVMLRNQEETIQVGQDTVQLVGVSGSTKGFQLYGGKECMDALESEYVGLRIVMAHIPALYLEELLPYSYDLAFAGHTHGGLVRLPRIGGLYSAEEGFLPTYSGGWYGLENGADLIVGCGLGDSGKIPRIFNQPELVVVDVNWF